MVFIYGTRLMGKCEQVPGLFHVATKFAHFDFVPLFPTESWVVFSQNGKQFRGSRIPMHAKSVLLTWGRFITFIAGIVGLFMAFAAFNKRFGNPNDWMAPAAIGVSCSVAFVFLRWHKSCTHASYERASQLAQAIGLNAAGLQILQRHFGQAAGRGFDVVPTAQPASFAPPPVAKPAQIPLAPERPLPGQPEWFYENNGQQSGPVPFETLRLLAASGQLTPQTYVWKEGMPAWAEAVNVQGLFSQPAMNGIGQTA